MFTSASSVRSRDNSRFTGSGSTGPPAGNVSSSCTAISSTGSFLAPPWLTKLGDAMYDFTVMLSHSVNNLRRAMHRPYWPVAERIKLSDWVESCSALVEKHSGELELLRWPHAAAGVRRPTAELLPDAA